jgi:hypothetical protein
MNQVEWIGIQEENEEEEPTRNEDNIEDKKNLKISLYNYT